jgi:hypothetical protein
MNAKPLVSPQTRNNWWIDSFLFLSGILVLFSSLYFLLWPSNGYQGGRNAAYEATIVFSRDVWDIMHTWAGVTMIVVAIIHIPLHWGWIMTMSKRVGNILLGRCERMNGGGQFNLLLNALLAISALLAALSGLYFLFSPPGWDKTVPTFLFVRSTWDVIHTWSGVVMMIAALLHFSIHWRWIAKVTQKIFRSVAYEQQPVAGSSLARPGGTR